MCAVVSRKASINVIKASEIRIKNLFKNNVPIYLSFSGGKDSLALAQLTFNLIQRGEIDPNLLTVLFIDEEAIFPCIEKTIIEWRKKFLMVGAKFEWYCIEVKHFNCFNLLTNDESFICWDREKEDVWVRKPPKFAIRNHPMLYRREDTYQKFCERAFNDGISVIGTRIAESVQRRDNIARNKSSMTNQFKAFPIYDWSNNDVWKYLLEQNVEIPTVYLYLYQSGVSLTNLRVSQFFSSDTARVLVKMNEYYPHLMERVIAREPNAYLAALYWDSEMFGRSSSKRKKIEGDKAKDIDYKEKLKNLLSDIKGNFEGKNAREVAKSYKLLYLKHGNIMSQRNAKRMYEGLLAGDPKRRTLRACSIDIFQDYAKLAKQENGIGGKK